MLTATSNTDFMFLASWDRGTFSPAGITSLVTLKAILTNVSVLKLKAQSSHLSPPAGVFYMSDVFTDPQGCSCLSHLADWGQHAVTRDSISEFIRTGKLEQAFIFLFVPWKLWKMKAPQFKAVVMFTEKHVCNYLMKQIQVNWWLFRCSFLFIRRLKVLSPV